MPEDTAKRSIQTERIFTRDAMSRPLFEEPDDQMLREDPRSGPQGFLIGDPSVTPTRVELAQQFFDAAHLLLETIRRGEWADHRLVNPALYLYRHSLELLVKAILGSERRTHDLALLADELDAAWAALGRVSPPWIIARLKEFAALDPNSTAFRYGENFDPATRQQTAPAASPLYVSVPHLQRAMVSLNAALHGAIPDITGAHPVLYFEDGETGELKD